MKITDEMVTEAMHAYLTLRGAGKSSFSEWMRAALTAALAAQPDRYARRAEKAREKAARLVEMQPYHSDFPYSERPDAMATKIRNMEMPDDPK